jgi:uncharacterized membrane protein (DUF373 family)
VARTGRAPTAAPHPRRQSNAADGGPPRRLAVTVDFDRGCHNVLVGAVPVTGVALELEDFAANSERIMRWLEMGAAYFLVALFAIGVFDLGLSLYELLISGRFTDPDAVIDLIDTVLLLLIIVEVFQTVIAFSRNEPVIRIVINAALIAIARKVISYRPGEYQSIEEAFVAAGSFTLLLAVLVLAFFVIRQVDLEPLDPDMDEFQ